MALPRLSPRGFRNASLATLVYNLAVVAWGALVRATGSGAGCGSHWPNCNGEVLPTSPTFKTLVEYTHRITTGLDAVLCFGLLALAFTSFPKGHRARLGAALFAGSMVLEILFGALLVKLGLVEQNASPERALMMSLHQVVTFYLFGSLALTVLWSTDELGAIRIRGQGITSALLLAALIALPLLAVSGAVAALGDTLFPSASFSAGMHADFSPAAHILLRLRILHPVIAILSFGLVMVASAMAAQRNARVREASFAVGILFLIQLGAGLLNLTLLAPTWMQLVHLALADLTWLAVVRMAALALAADPTSVLAADPDPRSGGDQTAPA